MGLTCASRWPTCAGLRSMARVVASPCNGEGDDAWPSTKSCSLSRNRSILGKTGKSWFHTPGEWNAPTSHFHFLPIPEVFPTRLEKPGNEGLEQTPSQRRAPGTGIGCGTSSAKPRIVARIIGRRITWGIPGDRGRIGASHVDEHDDSVRGLRRRAGHRAPPRGALQVGRRDPAQAREQ
jgi:hypothetical protein